MTPPWETDFDEWLAATHREAGDFTVLFVLMAIDVTSVTPLRSAWLHVLGDKTRWAEMAQLFAGAGVDWSGVVFWRAGREGLVPDAEARARLNALTRKLHEDRTLIRDGDFFNAEGLRLQLEEMKPH
ncbi:hypothetical protein EJV46_05125 [Roseococcus sp. SYP-B2431]|uniref:hypothetical protein n=1 Tax=Roseococcus sp. SYP-B2431 TaxID=2496640 RepID=UPI0010388E31|nr:hypothetical protein [Roseococcus sp. SYP-B2431]TCI00041.1 hypothetical protein EJV46_05125 [Roseococcus sp. SYP-B2431]